MENVDVVILGAGQAGLAASRHLTARDVSHVMLERGRPELAIPLFHGALESDSKFADAYFNLAMAYEQVGETQKARPYWKSYIALEPRGTWTEIAKRHL